MHPSKTTWFGAAHGGSWLLASALGVLTAFACDPQSDSDCTRGTEACLCTADGGCLPHLECISDYCVDPDWTPPADDEGDEGDDDDGIADEASASAGDDEDGTAPVDNVGACQAWIDGYDCDGIDLGQSLDCDLYAQYACDISDYFNCLDDNTSCTNGFPDTSGWAQCIDLANCQ